MKGDKQSTMIEIMPRIKEAEKHFKKKRYQEANEILNGVISRLKESGKSDDVSVNFHTVLQKAGFEYKLSGATVEVTQDSIVQSLTELVSPRLRELLSQDMQEA